MKAQHARSCIQYTIFRALNRFTRILYIIRNYETVIQNSNKRVSGERSMIKNTFGRYELNFMKNENSLRGVDLLLVSR